MKIVLEEGAKAPTRAHDTDAGLDIYSYESEVIHAHNSAIFRTGVHVQLPKNTAGVLISKSGLNVNHSITSTGLIDEGYTGEILVKLYNHSNLDYKVNKGDKISQLMVIPVLYPDIDIVDSLKESDRGNSGFGSTGK